MINFHPPEVVGRGSETQLQVGENLNKLTWHNTGMQILVQPPVFTGVCMIIIIFKEHLSQKEYSFNIFVLEHRKSNQLFLVVKLNLISGMKIY